MRRTAVFTIGILLASIPLFGADIPQMRGALVTDLTVNPNDSVLVRAAKIILFAP